ncbi:hypothetical protein KAR48_20235 [bacterium]|nr:hypothetical protein [bacterium]
MADTPDLGAAEEIFKTAETDFTEAETNFNTAQEAYKADESNEELKTAFTEQEVLLTTATETRDTAKTAFDELKESSNKGYWPEDWKERYVDKLKDKAGKLLDDAGKEKMMKRMARYASPRAAMDAMVNAQNKISSGGLVKIPGKDATKEELAQYRKDIGVPEEAKGYDLALGDGMVIGDEDKALVDEFLGVAHAGNYTQQQVTDGLNWYYQNQENLLAERYEADATFHSEAEEELRAEWGVEYKPNQNIMANYLGTDFGEGVAELITTARLSDGTLLADHPDILRGFVAKARAANPMGALVPGSGTKQAAAAEAQIETLEKKMETDGALKGKDQENYLKLISARDKIPEK